MGGLTLTIKVIRGQILILIIPGQIIHHLQNRITVTEVVLTLSQRIITAVHQEIPVHHIVHQEIPVHRIVHQEIPVHQELQNRGDDK